jgi:indole-3-glycerol phosphate synthase
MGMRRPADILVAIAAQRRERLAASLQGMETLAEASAAPVRDPGHPFLAALSVAGPSVIAEVKLGSPRLGDLRSRIDAGALVAAYTRAGAAALSVVVEEDHFFGSYELLEQCVRASSLPVLAKDFVIDPVQLEWAAEAGAAAVLLIASLHSAADLMALAGRARDLGLVPLVETHDVEDHASLASGDWEAVGVNNRDLRTFDVDLGHSVRMAAHLPAGAVKIAESGLSQPEHLQILAAAGFDAFLIGESLLLSPSPERQLRHLIGSADAD